MKNIHTAADTILDVALKLYAKRVPPSDNCDAHHALKTVRAAMAWRER